MKFDFSRLSRKTSSSKLIPEIDGLRFLAIITVVIFHLNTAYARSMGIEWLQSIQLLGGHTTPLAVGWWMVRLDMGVKVFFAISGFVLALPFLQHYLNGQPKVNLKQLSSFLYI
jgi:peptidoglycan/LPS O-acetylase OafA/YrhL